MGAGTVTPDTRPGAFMSVFAATRRTADQAASAPHLSVLARGLRVTGEIESDGIVTIEGRLDGVILGSAQVVVAPDGVVVGDVSAYEVIVSGLVEGDIAAAKRIELKPGGHVRGDVTAPRIVVHEGGEVNGRFTMRPPAEIPDVGEDRLRLSA